MLGEFDGRGAHRPGGGRGDDGGPERQLGALENPHHVSQVVHFGRDIEADVRRQLIDQPVRYTHILGQGAVVVALVERHRRTTEASVSDHGLLRAHHVAVGAAVIAIAAVEVRVHTHSIANSDTDDLIAHGRDDACCLVTEGCRKMFERTHLQQVHHAGRQPGGDNLDHDIERPGFWNRNLLERKRIRVLVGPSGEHGHRELLSSGRAASSSGE